MDEVKRESATKTKNELLCDTNKYAKLVSELDKYKQAQIKLKETIRKENQQFQETQRKNTKFIKTLKSQIEDNKKKFIFNAEVIQSQNNALKDRQD